MVINTNVEAGRTANNLNVSQNNLAKALSRLSSGQKIIDPSDDAAGLAVSSRLRAQIKRLDSALSNVINAVSFTQTQDGFMKTIDKALRRMGELAMLAKDGTKSVADRDLYDKEFQQLKSYIDDTTDMEFNGVSLFSTSDIAVTVDSEGETFNMPGIDLTASEYADAIAAGVELSNISTAGAALTLVASAISQIAVDRAQLGAVQSRLNFTSDQLSVTKENLSSAISRIADVDVAEEATQYARYQILVQSGTQMLTQANQLPNAALQLLRG
jgi:flagellin